VNDSPDQSAKKDEPRRRRVRSFLLNAALFVAVFLAATAFTTRNMLSADGAPAPELSGPTLAGEFYDLDEASAKPVLVYFFAPWCKICGAAADNLVRLRDWRNPEDLEIVAVALDWTSADDVLAYAQRHELNMPVVLGDPEIARSWQIYGFPSYYVLDDYHRVARRDTGYSSQFGLWWRTRAVEWFGRSM
jgi:peroxiredoxin